MKKKFAIITISLLALLIILNNYAKAQLTKEQLEAFRTARTVRIVVEQSYRDDENKEAKNINLLQKAIVGECLKLFGLQVLSTEAKNHDLEIKIKTKSIRYLLVEELIVDFDKIEGSISFEMLDIPIYTKAFIVHEGDIAPQTNLELIKEYRNIFSEDRTLYHLMTGFEYQIIYRLKEIFGISSLIARLKDENVTIRKYAAISLGYSYDPRAVEPLIEALKDNSYVVRYSASEALKYITGENFGLDLEKWQKWWEENKEEFLKKK